MKTKATAAAALSCVLLSACGGGSGSEGANASAGSRSAKAQDAMLRFAQCMRREGVDVGDPGENGALRIGPGDGGAEPQNPAKFRRAQQKCDKHLRAAGPPPELSEQQQEQFERKALAFARCMREQGIDLPDPQTSSDGRVSQSLPEGADPASARFREAEKACRKVGPQVGAPGEVKP